MSFATPPPSNPADTASFNKSSGKVAEVYTLLKDSRDATELDRANTLLDSIDTIQEVFQHEVAQYNDQMLLGDQFFGTSADPTLLNDVRHRNKSLTKQKNDLESDMKKSRAHAEQLDRDFLDEREALPETLTSSIIHVLDDYTLVVLMISYVFMMLACIFVYTASHLYSISSILTGVGSAFFISILLFIIASIIL